MEINDAEIQRIIEGVTKGDKKALTPPDILSLLLTLGGWVYSAGVLSERVEVIAREQADRTEAVASIAVLQNEIQHIKETVDQIRAGQSEILTAIGIRSTRDRN